MINEQFKELYSGLLHDVQQLWEQPRGEEFRAEACIRCSMRYWERLKDFVAAHPFDNKLEEIHLFREVKPRFIGRVEFYTLVFEASLFCPASGLPDAEEFWEKEYEKIDRFRKEQDSIVLYMQSGATHWDDEYLLRSGQGELEPALNRIYDPQGVVSAPMDGPLAMIIAYELYEEYLNTRKDQTQSAYDQ
ncbi:MAG: RteC domain-containing protein [Bacteroidota bacterium]|nr:RteC domain-containing protein [Bacteroidota bacterium]